MSHITLPTYGTLYDYLVDNTDEHFSVEIITNSGNGTEIHISTYGDTIATLYFCNYKRNIELYYNDDPNPFLYDNTYNDINDMIIDFTNHCNNTHDSLHHQR